ncbi:MAG TPA: zinc-binding alcohol dehydrogenase [Candidatus Limnocylindrales bacterium]|nr:zinc-binding alcohol dehydrogenase [Candidatus Limnocylindrales bacterium]
MAPPIDELVAEGRIGGRTVRIVDTGDVECGTYPVAPLRDGHVRVRTVRSAISPGTEMTFYGKSATNVYLHKTWDESLRLFVAGTPSATYPLTFGYRAAGEVVESGVDDVPVGSRVFGSWRHTEYTALEADAARRQALPADLSWDDGVDVAQMGPICVNAVAYAEGEHEGGVAVVFGAGPVGLLTAQIARAAGAATVHVVDRIRSRLAIAERLGFRTVEAAPDVDVAVTLKREHGSEGIAVAFECTGSARALHEGIRTVRRRGTVVAVGFYQGQAEGLFLGDEFHHNGIAVRCGQIGNVHPAWTWDRLRARTIELATSGQLVLGGLPRTTLPVERVAEGFAALGRPDEVLQVVLSYD